MVERYLIRESYICIGGHEQWIFHYSDGFTETLTVWKRCCK